jgi:hypothetical protein
LKVPPSIGQLDQDGAVTNVLSFGNNLPSKMLIKAPGSQVIAQNPQRGGVESAADEIRRH